MSDLERYAIDKLYEFLMTVDLYGLFFCDGEEVEEEMRTLVSSIISDYITEHEDKDE